MGLPVGPRRAIATICLAFGLVTPAPLKAQFATSGEKAAIYGGMVAAAGIVAVGVYFVLRKPSITGCTETSGNGLALRRDGGGGTYSLTGDVAQLKPGERIRVSGKRNNKEHTFVVHKLSKDFGPCHVTAGAQ